MNIIQAISISFINLKRHRLKTIMSIIIGTVSVMLLLLAITLNISQNEFIDGKLNNLKSNMVIREFTLKYSSDTNINDLEGLMNKVLKVPHIDKVIVLSPIEKNKVVMKITVDDYSKVMSVIDGFSAKEGYEAIVEEGKMINVEIIRVVKVISLMSLGAIIFLTYLIIIININSFIDDRKYEIALYKAFGYQRRHMFILLLLGNIFMIIFSFILASLLDFIIINQLSSALVHTKNITDIVGNKMSISLVPMGITLIICMVLTLISTMFSLKKVSKISAYMLLRASTF